MELLNKLIHPIFSTLTPEELKYLVKLAKIKTFLANEIIIREGDSGQEIYIILEGQVEVTKDNTKDNKKNNKVITLATLDAGSIFGEIATITNEARSATVTAVVNTVVLLLDIAVIKKDIQDKAKIIYEKILKNLAIELSKKIIYTRDKITKYNPQEQDEISHLTQDDITNAPNSILTLLGWQWADIMHEVPFLAAHGYDAIKLYPPQECVVRTGNPWWTIYQPVTYQLNSFFGTEEEFIKLVDFCHGYNIKIYIDLVLNHMAEYSAKEQYHLGSNGHQFGKYKYGSLNNENDSYEFADFFHFVPTGNKNISGEDYCKLENIWSLEHYDLVGLPTLNSDSKHVLGILRKYLKYLLSLGVDGFRIDAAKHLNIKAVEEIFSGLKTHDDLKPFCYQEYYTGGPMGLDIYSFMQKYFRIGYVTAFKYGSFLADAINNRSNNLQKLVEYSFGSSWLHYPENRAVVVIDNHDTERMMPNMLNYKNLKNNEYVLAYIFMLTWPFGVPKIMSSFRFSGHDDPIPQTRVWQNDRNTCFDENSPWVAQHRWNAIANMVLFRSKTKNSPGISHTWLNGNQIAFARTYQKEKEYVASSGFVVINATEKILKHKFETGLPSGRYNDLISSELIGNKMQGNIIEVEDYGFATITVKPFDAVVILLGCME
jgi:alpha-amylase